MCGIVGILTENSRAEIDEARLWAMLAPIKHRGPDQQAVYSLPGIGLGHARLSIIDLSDEANQPMIDPETQNMIVFNGEIYNYVELREALKDQGYSFDTSSDTEVILKAYRAWGTDCLNRFNGMWAFALYDHAKKHLFCARDRMGIKPFVFAFHQGDFVFASESKALLAAYPGLKQVDANYTCHFVETGEFGATQSTFYQAIENLLPGHHMIVRPGQKPEQERYWNWQPWKINSDIYELSDQAVQEQFEALLSDAIRLRFRSDVPVGVCLSGGLDSSAITALSVEAFGPKFPVFSCVYPEQPEVDESLYIQATVDRYKLTSHTTTVKPMNLIELMRQTLIEQDGPTGTSSILSQRAVMAKAKEHVTVVLSGQGGDEVVGGYHGYFEYHLRTMLRQWLKHPNWDNWSQYWQSAQAIGKRTGGKVHKLNTFKDRVQAALASPHFESAPYGVAVLDQLKPYATDDLSTKLLEDLTFKVLPRLLHYEDRNSMAVSLESRLPFLDYRLVEFMFAAHHRHKVRGATTKYTLSQILQNRLPESVLRRKDKMGFNAPSQRWFQNPADQKALQHYMDNRPAVLEGLSQEKWLFLKRSWQKSEQGQTLSTRAELNLWRYFITCLWLDV